MTQSNPYYLPEQRAREIFAHSRLGIVDRYHEQVADTGFGRLTARETHDLSYAGVLDSADSSTDQTPSTPSPSSPSSAATTRSCTPTSAAKVADGSRSPPPGRRWRPSAPAPGAPERPNSSPRRSTSWRRRWAPSGTPSSMTSLIGRGHRPIRTWPCPSGVPPSERAPKRAPIVRSLRRRPHMSPGHDCERRSHPSRHPPLSTVGPSPHLRPHHPVRRPAGGPPKAGSTEGRGRRGGRRPRHSGRR